MSTFLDTLSMELQLLKPDQLFEPPEEAGAGDHLVGEADSNLRKLYSAAMRWKKTAMEQQITAQFSSNRSEQRRAILRCHELDEKSKIIFGLFWTSLRDTFGLWDKPSVGIRKGWQVVWSEDRTPIIGIAGDDNPFGS